MKSSVPKESCGSSLKMVKYGASGTPMEINNKQAVFDVAPTWDGGGQAVCTKIMCVGGCVCVSVLVLQSAPC